MGDRIRKADTGEAKVRGFTRVYRIGQETPILDFAVRAVKLEEIEDRFKALESKKGLEN